MSAENDFNQRPANGLRPQQNRDIQPPPQDGEHALGAQAQRDEEIEQIQRQSKHQRVAIQKPPELPPAPPRKALIMVGVFLLLLLLAGAITLWGRVSHGRALAKETERGTVPTVAVVYPQSEKPDEELVLPGSLQAYEESPIYARTSGYLVRWYKDIGSKVTKGELLAKIDAPEVDQELNQTRAARQQTLAQAELAKISADRWENLRKTDSVSAQEADQQVSGYKQAQANLAASDANVRRLEQLEGFKDVYAPFTGVLTRRNVDPGALINAGAGVAGRELFDIARVDPLRVFTSVPQAYAPNIKVGAQTVITLQEFPGQKFTGKIARTAEAIDPATRTLLTEVDVPNKDGHLLPGSFGEVHFAVGTNVNKVTVPVNAMLFRSEGPQVAVVGSDNKVQLRRITIGRDYGTALEILGGVASGERVIINPPDSLEDGQQVNVAQPAQNQQKPAQPASQEQPPAEKQKAEKPKTQEPKNDRQKGSGQ
jgi:RND family efflux transporter MFP subunit